ncbi:MAG: BatD family protein [Cytophagaceae bacterium]
MSIASGNIFGLSKMMLKQQFFGLLIFFHLTAGVLAQETTISLGKSTIALNEEFSISLTFPKEKKKQFQSFQPQLFPPVTDLIKTRTTYSRDETNKEYKIVQYYKARKEGIIELSPFSVNTGDKLVSSKGLSIHVKAADPALEIVPETDDKDLEFKALKQDIFLKTSVNKTSPYWNEAVSVSVALCHPLPNSSEFSLIDLNVQLAEIRKKIRPINCWIEEHESSESIQTDTVLIGNKKYKRLILYSASFYALDTLPIIIPPVDFKIIRYRIAENKRITSFFRKPEEIRYTTQAYRLSVKSLPPHPLKDKIAVGIFRLGESVSSTKLSTGKSFNYNFFLAGEGNISSVPNPIIKENEVFEIYTPEVNREVIHKNNITVDARIFKYYIVPKEPGKYALRDYLYWVYFNPYEQKYDTLFPGITLTVQGESQKNNYISSNDLGAFYNTLDQEGNSLRHMEKDEFIKDFANFIILFMLVTTAILILRK